MAWKQKEKELSKDEALWQAKRELAPFWHHTEPLMAAVEYEGERTVVALRDDFEKSRWLVFFCDPTMPHLQAWIDVYNELLRRYRVCNVNPLQVIVSDIEIYQERRFIESFLIRNRIRNPTVFDHEGLYRTSFLDPGQYGIALWDGTKVAVSLRTRAFDGDAFRVFESKMQTYFRETDPGFAVPILIDLSQSPRVVEDQVIRIRKDCTFPENASSQGKWTHEADYWKTEDNNASVTINLKHVELHLFCSVVSKANFSSKIEITWRGIPMDEEFFGSDLQLDESGKYYIEVKEARSYQIIKKAPETPIELIIKTSTINRAGFFYLFCWKALLSI